MINETICLNSKGGRGGIEGLQPSLQDRVYDPIGVSPAVTTCYMPMVLIKNENQNKTSNKKRVY